MTQVFNYTNHTLLPEALETWPVTQLERMLPRHLQVIEQINAQHLDTLRAAGRDDGNLLASVSLIDEGPERRVKMGHLAFLGAHRVNGVSTLHTELMRQTVFRDLHALHPERIVNKTNGITFRRWLFQANPKLTSLIVEATGPRVLDDAGALADLAPLAGDAAFCERFAAIRRANKVALARLVGARLGVDLDADALFDVHIKRIHEYKRQLLNIIRRLLFISDAPTRGSVPGQCAGKAAVNYSRKLVIV